MHNDLALALLQACFLTPSPSCPSRSSETHGNQLCARFLLCPALTKTNFSALNVLPTRQPLLCLVNHHAFGFLGNRSSVNFLGRVPATFCLSSVACVLCAV